jgi:hypothetical protein
LSHAAELMLGHGCEIRLLSASGDAALAQRVDVDSSEGALDVVGKHPHVFDGLLKHV